jgi:hypothetical protein
MHSVGIDLPTMAKLLRLAVSLLFFLPEHFDHSVMVLEATI